MSNDGALPPKRTALDGRLLERERAIHKFRLCSPLWPQVELLEDERDGLSQRVRFLERQILSLREDSRRYEVL